MTDLKFVDQHNMVACLEKTEENAEFHQIVDFLFTCPINYALTAVVILKSSVRSDLLFNDEDGIACLINDEIFENLALMGYEQLSTKLTFQKGSFSSQWKFLIPTILHCISSKSTALKEFSTNLALAVICLAKGGGDSVERAITIDASLVVAQDSDNLIRTQTTAMPNVDIPQGVDTGGSPKRKETIGALLLKLEREGCTSSGDPQTKAMSQEIRKKEEVKHLTPKKEDIQADSDFDVLDDDMEDVEGETVHTDITGISVVSAPVTTDGVTISTPEPRTPPTTAATTFIDKDLTIAQTLIKMKEEKAKEKGVAIKDVEYSTRPIRSITTLQHLPTIDPKDKGKGVMVEEEPEKPEKVKRRDQGLPQIESDAELAQRLHEEELAELDIAQKERQKQEEATSAALAEEFDEIQARIDADHELAVRLTHEEQEKYTIEERARLLAEFFERRKK
ncbi:hypothetical protein Tco_1507417 [Tanacetum coccineum]